MDELREFLRDLLRPFGMRHLRRFLRGNWWILLILIAAAGYGIFQSPLEPIITGRVWDGAPDPKFTFLDGSGFDLETCKGSPGHAIDLAGDLIPIFERNRNKLPVTLTVWSRSQKKAVLRAQWDRPSTVLYREKVLHNPKTGEIIVGINMPLGAELSQLDDAIVLVIDPATQTIRDKFSIPRLTQLCDVSPSGKFAVGLQIPLEQMLTDSDVFAPVIINLETGDWRSMPIRIDDCRFGNDGRLICLRPDGIVYFDLTDRRGVEGSSRPLRDLAQESLSGRIDGFFDTRDANRAYALAQVEVRGDQAQQVTESYNRILSIPLRASGDITWENPPIELSKVMRNHYGFLPGDWINGDYDPVAKRVVTPATVGETFACLLIDLRLNRACFVEINSPREFSTYARFVGPDMVFFSCGLGSIGKFIPLEALLHGKEIK